MPELPEVETMVAGIRGMADGQTIVRAKVLDAALVDTPGPRSLERQLRGRRVRSVSRRGKRVLLELDSGCWLLIEPRMTGSFRLGPQRPDYARLLLELAGPERHLWFCDLRRFARIALVDEAELQQRLGPNRQGPDALKVSAEYLQRRLSRSSRTIKTALVDQQVLAGVGNIYADEALFLARIHPARSCSTLSEHDWQRLARAVRRVLRDGIRAGGTSIRNYVDLNGQPGRYQLIRRVYGRAGEPCPNCGRPIQRAKVRGLATRSSHFCPRCQK